MTVEESYKRRRIADGLVQDTLGKGRYGDGYDRIYYNLPSLSEIYQMVAQKPIYRLEVNENCLITVECYDLIENFAPELRPCYDAAKDLPKWAQEKLAVLMVLDPDEPTGEIEGVGRRINRRVFWIYPNGNDAGSESKSRH